MLAPEASMRYLLLQEVRHHASGPRRITVIGVATLPPLTPRTLRALAMEILRRWEARGGDQTAITEQLAGRPEDNRAASETVGGVARQVSLDVPRRPWPVRSSSPEGERFRVTEHRGHIIQVTEG